MALCRRVWLFAVRNCARCSCEGRYRDSVCCALSSEVRCGTAIAYATRCSTELAYALAVNRAASDLDRPRAHVISTQVAAPVSCYAAPTRSPVLRARMQPPSAPETSGAEESDGGHAPLPPLSGVRY
eukprot:152552-Rhodomonas_salina.1